YPLVLVDEENLGILIGWRCTEHGGDSAHPCEQAARPPLVPRERLPGFAQGRFVFEPSDGSAVTAGWHILQSPPGVNFGIVRAKM
ncbi:MAG TPA: hypothetical protein VF844_19360, partial [Ktedonobacteraceae bacterium]